MKDYKETIEPGVDVNIISDNCNCQECHCDDCHCDEAKFEPIKVTYERTKEGIMPNQEGKGKDLIHILAMGDIVNYGTVVDIQEDSETRRIVVDYFGDKQYIDKPEQIFTCLAKEVLEQWKDSINSAMGKYENYPKDGVLFEDINPVLRDRDLLGVLIEMFAININNPKVDYIIAPESRGFIFGSMVSVALQKPILLARKPGKLPGDVLSVTYDTEYSKDTLELQKVDLTDKNVWFIDDVFATGGTYQACKELIENCNGNLMGGTVIKSVLDKQPEEVKVLL